MQHKHGYSAFPVRFSPIHFRQFFGLLGLINEHAKCLFSTAYRKTSNIRHTLVGNKIVDH